LAFLPSRWTQIMLSNENFAETHGQEVITDSEIQHFRENGFVIPAAGLSDDDAANMRETIERILLENPDWHGIVRMPHVPIREGQLEGLIAESRCSALPSIQRLSKQRDAWLGQT